MGTVMSKITYYTDKNFTFSYEIDLDRVVLHCSVACWKTSVLKQMYKVFSSFLNDMAIQGFSNIITATPNPKFARLFGGTSVHTFTYLGKEIEVIKWE